MKLLFHQWPSFFQRDVQEILGDIHIAYDLLCWDFRKNPDEEQFLVYVRDNINMAQYDLLFSINYWPSLSRICQQNHIRYVAWCYDAPLPVENIEDTLANEVNSVFCFDRIQATNYRAQGYRTVHHLPLGVNVKRLENIDKYSSRCAAYNAQVSFVGKLYESVADWLLLHADEYCKGYMRAVIDTQRELYGAYIIDQTLTDSFMTRMNQSFDWPGESTRTRLHKEHISFALSCEATRRDRIILLSLCGQRFDTRFYSYQDSSVIKNVKKCSPVNYWEEMPYVFAASKVNLNISLRSIQTGIPLRALDIMGCGGFLVSNYQEELNEMFTNGEEIVLYESMEDAIAKIEFYLKHEDLREKIALWGRQKTFLDFNMRDRLVYMFQFAGD